MMSFEEFCQSADRDPRQVAARLHLLQWGPLDGPRVQVAIENGSLLEALDTEWEERLARIRAFAQRSVGPRSFRTLGTTEALKLLHPRLTKWLRAYETGTGALLTGPTGCGKSLAGALVGRRLVFERLVSTPGSAGWTNETWMPDAMPQAVAGVAWTSAPQLAAARRGHPFGNGDAPLVRVAKTAQTLVLDDLGWEVEGELVAPEVLHERMDAGLPTIVTSGRSPEELGSRYGAALVRRIIETEGRSGFTVRAVDETKTALRAVAGGRS